METQWEVSTAVGIGSIDDLGWESSAAFIAGKRIPSWECSFLVGAGAEVTYYVQAQKVFVPFFGNVRWYFMEGRKAPFIDYRLGYSFVNGWEKYQSFGMGYSFSCGKRIIHIQAALTLLHAKGDVVERYLSGGSDLESFLVRVGWEF